MTDTGHKMVVRIPKEVHKAAKVKAAQSDVTLSEAVRDLLQMWVAGKVELPTEIQEAQEET